MSLSRSDLEAGNEQTRLLEPSHSGIKLTTLSEDELQRSLDESELIRKENLKRTKSALTKVIG
ncbi:hypothetical protein H1Q63_24710 [Desmonostoc muscorum CCALA 125]|nr:hypothetical protein [Desmonostoc muscorum CCALA 125]